MSRSHPDSFTLEGVGGSLAIDPNDEVAKKFAMLYEGQCGGVGPSRAAAKYGYTKQRYFQLLERYREQGTEGLRNQKRGPKTNYRRTDEVVRQVVRHRFLDPDASSAVIAQKIRQCGLSISVRSVERIIQTYGLQKKTVRRRSPFDSAGKG
jgi:transposase